MRFIILIITFMVFAAHATERWSMDLQQMPLRYLLQTLADLRGQNIAMGHNIQGKLDLHLEDVEWEQLWHFLLNSQHLAIQNNNGIVWVDKTYSYLTADKNKLTPPQLKVLMKKFQYVEVKKIVQMLQDKNNAMVSSWSKLMWDERTNTLWVSDLSENIQFLKDFFHQLDKPISQIEIQARIVSMNMKDAKALGVKLGFLDTNNQSIINLPATSMEANPISVALNMAQAGLNYIDLELSALEGKGAADIIASPRLVTSNQEVASIASGEDIPYQESSLNGATTVSFKKALLKLKVRPYVLANHRLLLEIEINQDADSGQRVQGVPIISTKTMKTKVYLKSGETVVLGGIHQRDNHHENIGVPLLKNIPLLGHFFSRHQYRNIHEQLVLFLTPKILESHKDLRLHQVSESIRHL